MFAQEIVGLAGNNAQAKTIMSYSEDAPFQVCFSFPEVQTEDTDWIFGRDILIDTFEVGIGGEGDVRARLNGSSFSLTLGAISNSGGFILHYPRDEVASFLNQTLGMVPRGTESLESEMSDEEINGWFFGQGV